MRKSNAEVRRDILLTLKNKTKLGPWTTDLIAKRVEAHETTVIHILKQLQEEGLVVNHGYQLV